MRNELNEAHHMQEKFWSKANALELKLLNFEESHAEISQRLIVADKELDLLKKTNILNDLFYIDQANQVGTINGLRLGRLSTDNVPWEEINAAWGQCTLLLQILMQRCKYVNEDIGLVPMSSFSRIYLLNDPSNRFELFSSEASFSKVNNRFNTAQHMYLVLVKDFIGFLEHQQSTNINLPYNINDDTIGDMSIKYEPTNKERWTRALRFLLQVLKSLLVWVARL